jgi:hypothetical protein
MKKSSTKLQLKKGTIRSLQDSALDGVRGGADAVLRGSPTNEVILCVQSNNCSPNHP